MRNSLNEPKPADSAPRRLDAQSTAAKPFARIEDALQYAAGELKAGRCVTVWPVDAASYRLASWRFEKHGEDAHFAPTAPLGLDLPD